MRLCQGCGKEDRPELDATITCNCGVVELDPLLHRDECFKVRHAVRPQWIKVKDEAEWKLDWERKGWGYKFMNKKHQATKLLCDNCMNSVNMSLEAKRAYQRACKAVRGEADANYVQILCS